MMSDRKLSWEDVHAQREWGRWPESALVRFVFRTFKPEPGKYLGRAVDLGCGAGASSGFLAEEGFTVDGIDISPSAVQRCVHRIGHRKVGHRFWLGDIGDHLPFRDAFFDLAVDVASTQHLEAKPRINAIVEAHRVLKPGGWLFSMCLADGTDDELLDHMNACPLTFSEIEHVYSIFGVPQHVEHEMRTDLGRIVSHWIIVVQKK